MPLAASVDLREGGAWGLRQRLKNATLYALARVALSVAGVLPDRWLVALGGFLGVLASFFLRRRRQIARENLSAAFPGMVALASDRLVRQNFRTLGRTLGETVALLSSDGKPRALRLTPGSMDAIRQARACGRGVVLASAHLGPWEHVAASLAEWIPPFVAVAREAYDPRFTDLYTELRRRLGVDVIYRGDATAHLRIARALREGVVLGVPMDLRARVPSVLVPLLGRSAWTPLGPARLALRLGAPVVVGTAVEHDGEVRISIVPVTSSDLEPGEEGERMLTARINAELGRRIRRWPEAWPWMHERWEENRPGATSPSAAGRRQRKTLKSSPEGLL